RTWCRVRVRGQRPDIGAAATRPNRKGSKAAIVLHVPNHGVRESVLETRPSRTRHSYVVRKVQTPVSSRENLPGEFRVGEDRVDRDIREVAGLVAPGEGGAVGRADQLEDVAGRSRSVCVETTHGGVGNWRSRGRRIESN